MTIVLEGVSGYQGVSLGYQASKSCAWKKTIPLFSAPQHSQWRMFFSLPFEGGRRLPQSVQKITEPIAAILGSKSVQDRGRVVKVRFVVRCLWRSLMLLLSKRGSNVCFLFLRRNISYGQGPVLPFYSTNGAALLITLWRTRTTLAWLGGPGRSYGTVPVGFAWFHLDARLSINPHLPCTSFKFKFNSCLLQTDNPTRRHQ